MPPNRRTGAGASTQSGLVETRLQAPPTWKRSSDLCCQRRPIRPPPCGGVVRVPSSVMAKVGFPIRLPIHQPVTQLLRNQSFRLIRLWPERDLSSIVRSKNDGPIISAETTGEITYAVSYRPCEEDAPRGSSAAIRDPVVPGKPRSVREPFRPLTPTNSFQHFWAHPALQSRHNAHDSHASPRATPPSPLCRGVSRSRRTGALRAVRREPTPWETVPPVP